MEVLRLSTPDEERPDIPVEFVVVHYTVESLEDTLRLFADPQSGVSAHLVISPEGVVHELVTCWDGVARRAGHAGLSRWSEGQTEWEGFNGFSIGVEIVNRNGNLFPYTEAQYRSLAGCLRHLARRFPALVRPERVLGHEQIAGWRGKVDPGVLFDWGRVYRDAYPGLGAPARRPACPPELVAALAEFRQAEPVDADRAARFWRAVNLCAERSVDLIVRAKASGGGEQQSVATPLD